MASAAVFIDGQYFYKVLEEEFPKLHPDISKLGSELCKAMDADVELLRSYYYDAMPYKSANPDAKELSLRERKRKMLEAFSYFEDFEVRTGRCIKVFDKQGNARFLQKGIDTELSIDLTRLSATGRIGHAILIAGDGDFVPPIRAAKQYGVKIWLFHGQSCSRALIKEADRRIPITEELLLRIKR